MMGNLEEMRISYNKGYLDAKKEWLMLFISWIGKQDLKRYDAGWCQPGGTNGMHLSDEELYYQFLS